MSYGQNVGGSSKPVQTGNEYTVDITDTGRDGEGVARIGGLIIFCEKCKSR